MHKLTVIAAFGALGSVLRYLLARWVQQFVGSAPFPNGTLIVNLVGCFAIGLCGAYFLGHREVREEYRLAVMVGLLGGFTTFSSYAWETTRLAADVSPSPAVWNILLSNGLGLVLAEVAFRLGTRLFGA